jgi:ferric-dicitrate binding protein FerR (iron transport regulator)
MKKRNYTKIEDFINDTSFINWARNNNLSDIAFWDMWIIENPFKKQLALDAKNILVGVQFNKTTLSDNKVQLEWDKFEDRINSRNKETISLIPFYKNKKYISIAASIMILIFSGFYVANQPTKIIHKTAFGEIINIKLQDGTIVTLNSNSTLSYKEDNFRKVSLNGEAFFNVEKKTETNAKFWVNTNDLRVEVFGTQFNVNSRNKKTQVFLQEGSIELKLKNGKEKKMVPGDLVSYSSASNRILEEKRSLRPELQTSWKDGSLIFDRSTLKSAMNKIEETYGITTIFEDIAIEKILLTGAVPTENIDICIKTIEKSAQVQIINKNNKLYISKN